MGNPTLRPDVFRTIGPAPPFAPPAQPGEVRSCMTCVRCGEVLRRMDGMPASIDCLWQGQWDWPAVGCNRWAAK